MSLDVEIATGTVCKNCEITFEGKYCPTCSQKADTHRFTIKHILHDFFHAFTHTDKGILYLIRELFVRPGKVALEYNAGKRKKYFSPITFLLITMAIWIFLSQKTDFNGATLRATQSLSDQVEKQSGKENDATERFQEIENKSKALHENSKLLVMLLIPAFALLTWLFFKRSGFNYAENLIFNIFLQGQTNVFFIIFCIPIFLIYPPSVLVLSFLYIIGVWFYSLIAYQQFYKQRKWLTIIKGSIVQALSILILQLLTSAFIEYL
jgi:hypothetical protein